METPSGMGTKKTGADLQAGLAGILGRKNVLGKAIWEDGGKVRSTV